jgi:hypothetical protein
MATDFDAESLDGYPRVPCPRCGRSLACVGMVTVHGGEATPVYQCEDCVTPFLIEGVSFDGAYTFTLDAAGRPVDHEL